MAIALHMILFYFAISAVQILRLINEQQQHSPQFLWNEFELLKQHFNIICSNKIETKLQLVDKDDV